MDAALGPPEKMAENADELTPMMSQYFEICERYDDSLVLFQVGDFYEAFEAAAEKVARLCEITLTKREDSTGQYAMAGIPIDNAESYVETLLDAGYRVAVADQVEDPDEVSGLVERAVTRIITPGTLTEDALLRSPDNNYVAALTTDSRRFGLALLDVSTGDFYATSAETSMLSPTRSGGSRARGGHRRPERRGSRRRGRRLRPGVHGHALRRARLRARPRRRARGVVLRQS